MAGQHPLPTDLMHHIEGLWSQWIMVTSGNSHMGQANHHWENPSRWEDSRG